MIPEETAEFDFDVAISFAGEDRDYAHALAHALREANIAVFYDEFFKSELWGEDLVEQLDNVYQRRARFAVVVVSEHYVAKPWPRHERRSVLARSVLEDETYLLPIQLDDSTLPGLRPTVGYLNGRTTSNAEIVDLVLKKLGEPSSTTSQPRIPPTPRTPEALLDVMRRRPDFWEHLLFAGYLVQGAEGLEGKWRDHDFGFIRATGRSLDAEAAIQWIGPHFNRAVKVSQNMDTLLSERVQELAFGPDGKPGDPAQIQHMTKRLLDCYEELLDIEAEIRGTHVPEVLERSFELAADMYKLPIRQFREFFHRVAAEMDQIPHRLETEPHPVVIKLTLTMSIEDGIASAYTRELDRAKRKVNRQNRWGL